MKIKRKDNAPFEAQGKETQRTLRFAEWKSREKDQHREHRDET